MEAQKRRPRRNTGSRFPRCVALAALLALLATALPPPASAFVPAPQTDYARDFVALCDNQQWFIDEIERQLNTEQESINTIKSAEDLSVIKSLGLRDKNIAGIIPRAIGELSELRHLFLSGNKLDGTIPAELFNLPKLQNLDLSNNNYAGAVPTGFGTMPALNTLNLRGNAYAGPIPTDILYDTTLVFLDVSSNRVSGTMPDFSAITALEYLAVSDNPWTTGEIPNLPPSLKTLSMWNTGRIGEIPAALYALTSLEILDLSANRLSGGFGGVSTLVNLQYLSLGRNEFAGTIPDAFAPLTELETVDLSNNKLRGTVPDEFLSYDSVYVETNYLTGESLKELTGYRDNFCDEAGNPQYRLSADSPRVISQSVTNMYLLLRNRPLQNSPAKGILPADCYGAEIQNDSDGKVTLTYDDSGIFVRANEEIPRTDGITIKIWLKDNDGSDYSTVMILLTTEAPASFGAGAGSPEPTPAPEPTPEPIIHEPYVNGYPDGTFGPDKNVTREQAAAMLARVLGLDTSMPPTDPFPDVERTRWSAPHIAAAKRLGYFKGYDDGTFKPDNPITRAELSAVLARDARARGVSFAGTAKQFTDVSADKWYAEYISEASGLGLITGYPDGTFRPEMPVTRAETVAMINRAFGRDPDTTSLTSIPFSDVTETHWAYLHIQEASVRHEH